MKKRTGGLFKPIPGTEPPKKEPQVSSTVNDEIMTDEDVMSLLKVNLQWLRDHTTRTEPIIPHIRMGRTIRYHRSEVIEFLKAMTERRPVWDRNRSAA